MLASKFFYASTDTSYTAFLRRSQERHTVSTALFLEYEDVLNRPVFLDETGFTARDMHRFLSGFAAASSPVEIHFRWRPQLTDPNDEFVLEAAVNAGHVPLVTHHTRDFVIATQRFNLLVLTPGQFLRKLTP